MYIINDQFSNANPIEEYGQQETSYAFLDSNLRLREAIILSFTFIALITGALLVYHLEPNFQQLKDEKLNTVWGTVLTYISYFLLGTQVCFLAFVAFLYKKYKAIPSVSDELLPTCTVIVPAYNEGKLVYDTLLSLAASDYPEAKLQLLAIDDGSKDDTWEWMQKAKNKLGDKVTILQQPKNMGKRHALYRGFHLGTGEIFITVDSDSIVRPDTLRNMTSPFVVNKDCGAVAGNVKVLNTDEGIIPKMLNVSFVFSFEFIRSAQSVLGSVLCTPGALSAYKKDAVMNCLETWIHQTFMGQPSDIGEDRAMTNMILKQGYHVVFQKNAHVLTDVPTQYENLQKMFTRWERSNVRENIMMTKFAFTNFRKGSKLGARILLLNQWLNVIFAIPLLFATLFFALTHPILFITSVFAGILVFSSIQVFFYAKKQKNLFDALWAYPYSIFYTFALFWITPYAILTANKRGWLTRTIK